MLCGIGEEIVSVARACWMMWRKVGRSGNEGEVQLAISHNIGIHSCATKIIS